MNGELGLCKATLRWLLLKQLQETEFDRSQSCGEMYTKVFHAYWCRVGFKRCGKWCLARRKSPILTAQTTREFQKEMDKWRVLVLSHLPRIQDLTLQYTMAWLQSWSLWPHPPGRNRKYVEKGEEIQREKVRVYSHQLKGANHVGRYIPSILSLLHLLTLCDVNQCQRYTVGFNPQLPCLNFSTPPSQCQCFPLTGEKRMVKLIWSLMTCTYTQN